MEDNNSLRRLLALQRINIPSKDYYLPRTSLMVQTVHALAQKRFSDVSSLIILSQDWNFWSTCFVKDEKRSLNYGWHLKATKLWLMKLTKSWWWAYGGLTYFLRKHPYFLFPLEDYNIILMESFHILVPPLLWLYPINFDTFSWGWSKKKQEKCENR